MVRWLKRSTRRSAPGPRTDVRLARPQGVTRWRSQMARQDVLLADDDDLSWDMDWELGDWPAQLSGI